LSGNAKRKVLRMMGLMKDTELQYAHELPSVFKATMADLRWVKLKETPAEWSRFPEISGEARYCRAVNSSFILICYNGTYDIYHTGLSSVFPKSEYHTANKDYAATMYLSAVNKERELRRRTSQAHESGLGKGWHLQSKEHSDARKYSAERKSRNITPALVKKRGWRIFNPVEWPVIPYGVMITLKRGTKAYQTHPAGKLVPASRITDRIWFVDGDLGNGMVNINTWRPIPGAYCSDVSKRDIAAISVRAKKHNWHRRLRHFGLIYLLMRQARRQA